MSLKMDLKLHNLPFTHVLCGDKKDSNRELQGGSVPDFVRHKNFALEPALTLPYLLMSYFFLLLKILQHSFRTCFANLSSFISSR